MATLTAHHVGTVVSDLEAALAFYRDTLGFEEASTFTLDGPGIEVAIDEPGVVGEFVHLDGNGIRVELTEYDPAGEPGTVHEVGAKHLGFLVDDIEAFYDELPEAADPVSDPVTVGTGSDIFFFRDPDGNFIEAIGR